MNYGDVSLLLRGWLDLCAEFAWRHYDGNPPVIPPDNACYRQRLAQERILAFCQNEPKGIREIGRCSATGTRRPSGSILTRCRLPAGLYGPYPTGPAAGIRSTSLPGGSGLFQRKETLLLITGGRIVSEREGAITPRRENSSAEALF